VLYCCRLRLLPLAAGARPVIFILARRRHLDDETAAYLSHGVIWPAVMIAQGQPGWVGVGGGWEHVEDGERTLADRSCVL